MINKIAQTIHCPLVEAEKIFEKVKEGGEINANNDEETWLHQRFLPNLVSID